MVLALEALGEVRDVGVEDLESAAIELRERVRSLYEVNGRSALRACLGEVERAFLEAERRLRELAGDRLSPFPPPESAGDHEVDDDEDRVVRSDHDALPEPADGAHVRANHPRQRRRDR